MNRLPVLTPISVIDIKRIIEHLRDSGLGVLITDHNVRETLAVCERAYIVSRGHLIAHGTPQQILEDEHVKRVYLGKTSDSDRVEIIDVFLSESAALNMKQGLQLRLSQQLAMTPQLQQAIRLLQLSTSWNFSRNFSRRWRVIHCWSKPIFTKKWMPNKTGDNEGWIPSTRLNKRDARRTAAGCKLGRDLYRRNPSGSSNDYLDDELPIYQGETTQSLQDYLMWQVELTPFSDTDRAIATSIVDAVDDTGYLTVSLEDILESMGRRRGSGRSRSRA